MAGRYAAPAAYLRVLTRRVVSGLRDGTELVCRTIYLSWLGLGRGHSMPCAGGSHRTVSTPTCSECEALRESIKGVPGDAGHYCRMLQRETCPDVSSAALCFVMFRAHGSTGAVAPGRARERNAGRVGGHPCPCNCGPLVFLCLFSIKVGQALACRHRWLWACLSASLHSPGDSGRRHRHVTGGRKSYRRPPLWGSGPTPPAAT